MSHVVHSVTKVFSKVWDFVKPIVKVVAIAAAVYFTAGLALSAFPATAAFAAAMPGFAADGVAGAGVFSQAAGAIGLGGGLQAGAIADATAAAAAGSTAVGAGVAADAAASAGGAAAAGGEAAAGGAAAASAVPTAYTGAAAAGGAAAGSSGVAAIAPTMISNTGLGAMGLTDKLLLASVATQAVSGFMAPTAADIQKAKNGWYGAFYGVDSNGKGTAAPNQYLGPQTEPKSTFGAQPASQSLVPSVGAPQAPQAPVGPSGPNLGSGPNMGTLAADTGAAPALMPPVQKPQQAGA